MQNVLLAYQRVSVLHAVEAIIWMGKLAYNVTTTVWFAQALNNALHVIMIIFGFLHKNNVSILKNV